MKSKTGKGGKSKARKGEESTNQDDFDKEVDDLIRRMREAYELDREANKARKPAIKRLLMAPEVYKTIRKLSIQEEFGQEGIETLAEWIDVMPDGTFPNYNLVKGVLECLDFLPIDSGVKDSKDGVLKILSYYANGFAKMP